MQEIEWTLRELVDLCSEHLGIAATEIRDWTVATLIDEIAACEVPGWQWIQVALSNVPETNFDRLGDVIPEIDLPLGE